MTLAAYEEFLAKIPAALGGIGADTPPTTGNANGSPGWRLRELVSQWVQINRSTGAIILDNAGKPIPATSVTGAPTPNDFAATNIGQLKAVASPFFDRLQELMQTAATASGRTFQQDPAWVRAWSGGASSTTDYGMANIGQLKRSFALDLNSDADGDGVSNMDEFLAGSDPFSQDNPDVHLTVFGYATP